MCGRPWVIIHSAANFSLARSYKIDASSAQVTRDKKRSGDVSFKPKKKRNPG